MSVQLTLANFPTWLRTVPPQHRTELQAKWQYKTFLTSNTNLELPDLVWLAFLVPDELQEDSEVKTFRAQGQAAFRQPEKFIDITDPLAPESPLVALCLVGLLYDLDELKVHLPYDSYQLWAEVANNFGMWRLRYHLEDAVFKNFDAENYQLFDSVVQEKLSVDEALVEDIKTLVEIGAKRAGVKKLKITNREKNVFGVYKKVQVQHKNLNEIYDIHGFRLFPAHTADCYKMLEVVHNLWRPFPHRLKDYIKNPKPNGYQSLHTTVACLQRHPVEFQIRTPEMDAVAVSGLANHAAYKKEQRLA